MNLQARRISGSSFSAEDKLEVTFSSDNQPMASVVHTIELVSGVNVTHGGGGQPNEYLHYKATERDADSDGVIDYSDVEMALVQMEKGTSLIKVVCEVVTQANADTFNIASASYIERATLAGVTEELPEGTDGSFTEEAPTFEPTILTTGEITLEWSDDNFV
jgi:hypothetical protein